MTLTENGVRRQSYKETRDRSHQLAHALAGAGIKIGDRVGTFMWNGSRHLEAYHACAGMGAVLHTLNVRLSEKDLEYIINHAEDQIIIADADVLPLLENLNGKIPTVRKIVVATEEGFEGWTTRCLTPSITKPLLMASLRNTNGHRLTKIRQWDFATPVAPLVIPRAWNMSIAPSICTRSRSA